VKDESRLKELAAIGREAKAIVENARFNAAFDKIEQFLLDAIGDSCVDEQMIREDAYRQMRLLRKLRDVLKKEVIDGDGAMKELLQLNDPSRLKRFINGRR
jgi:hypothetical protein